MTISKSSLIKTLLLLFLLFAGLHFAKGFLMPLTIGGVLATLFLPLCKWLESKKVPKALAVLLCLFVLLIILTAIASLLGWQLSSLASDLPLIKEKGTEWLAQVQTFVFNHLGISSDEQMELLKNEQPSFTNIFQLLAGSFSYLFTNFILILVYLFCLLYYRSHLKKFILQLTAPAEREEMELVVNNAAKISQQYLLGLTKMIGLLWIMYGIGFSILGIKNALFFAVLCGILEIVPYVGNITGTSLTVFVAAVQGASLPMIGGIIGIYAFVQFIQGWVLEPLIVGPQVKLNPFSTIIALVLGQLVWGIPGIFLAIPLTAMLKIACDNFESLKPYGFLIGSLEKGKKEAS